MTITALATRNEYTAGGSGAGSEVFSYTFKIYEETDLSVYLTPVGQEADDANDLITPTGVIGVGDEDGGSVFVFGTVAGDKVTIVSNIAQKRVIDYQVNGDFSASVVNTDFDRTVSLVKQLSDEISRSLKYEESEQGVSGLTLPMPSDGLYLRWRSDLTGLENTGTPAIVYTKDPYASIADLKAATNLSINDIVETTAYYSDLIGGGAKYLIVAAGTGVDDGGSYIDLSGSGLQAELVYASVGDVLVFGAKGDDINDDTIPIQNAYDFFDTTYIPDGIFITTSTINIDREFTKIYGNGSSSIIKFSPTVDTVCFNIELANGTGVIVQTEVSGISFVSEHSAYAKTAVKLVDSSSCILDNLRTHTPQWGAIDDGSIFLHIAGRELGAVSNIVAIADRPLLISPIPAPHVANNIGIDHFNFNNLYLINRSSVYPVIEMQTGLLLTQTSFTGYQSWIGGAGGLYWVDTTTTGVSNGLYLGNIRSELTADDTQYLVRIENNTNLQGLVIDGGQAGGLNGFYLRDVDRVSFKNFYFTSGTKEALNIDGTVVGVSATNCFWQSGSTATIAGQRVIFESPKNPNTGALPPTFLYDDSANGDIDFDIGARLNLEYGQIVFPATPNPSTNVNTLDQYEEGAFTPTWLPASGSGQTVNNAYGVYTKIGNRVIFDIFLSTNGHGTASGDITIGGFPYACAITGIPGGGQSIQADNAAIIAGDSATLVMVSNTDTALAKLFDATTGTTALQASEWGVSGSWRFTGAYMAST